MHSFRLVETPCYTAEKNTIDMVPASDAMDILHGGGIDCFCIAASDGDYTMLAQRIREAGLTVLGEGKTPEALVASCREFRYAGQQQGVEPELQPNTPEHLIRRDMPLFEKAFETAATGKDEVPLSQTGTAHKKLMSKYRIKRYGCKTLGGSPSGSTGTSSSRRRKRVWREEKTLSSKISYTSEYRKAGLVRGLFFKDKESFSGFRQTGECSKSKYYQATQQYFHRVDLYAIRRLPHRKNPKVSHFPYDRNKTKFLENPFLLYTCIKTIRITDLTSTGFDTSLVDTRNQS